MPIESVYVPVRAACDGVSDEYDFDFKVWATSEIKVSLVDQETGVATLKTLGIDYTVTLNAVTDGGTVTFTEVPADTNDYLFESNLAETQGYNLATKGKFNQAQVISGLDRLCRLIQQVSEKVGRAVIIPTESGITDITLPSPVDNYAIAWDGTDGAMKNVLVDTDAIVAAVVAAELAQTNAETAETNAELAQSAAEAAQAAAEEAAENFEFASQAEAEAGTNETKSMNPLRTAQAISARGISGLGTPVAKSDNTVYQATSNGFVYGYLDGDADPTSAFVTVLSDSGSPPSTIRTRAYIYRAATGVNILSASYCVPVKKNDYYKSTKTVSTGSATNYVFFIPMD